MSGSSQALRMPSAKRQEPGNFSWAGEEIASSNRWMPVHTGVGAAPEPGVDRT